MPTCSVTGCGIEQRYLARGYCERHYARWRVHGDPLKVLPRGLKKGQGGWHAVIKESDMPRLKALLAENCLTFSKIGRRFGVTRERIRQLAKKMGFDRGHDRQVACTLNRSRMEAQAKFLLMYPELIAACGKQGLSAEPVLYLQGNFYRVTHQRIYINGKYCTVQKASCLNGLVHFQLTRCGVDFYIIKMADDWLIVPRALGETKRQTTFVRELRRPELGAKSYFHGWRDYINAWHLLK